MVSSSPSSATSIASEPFTAVFPNQQVANMKFSTIPVVAFAMGAAAQLATIQGVITTISNSVGTLDTSAKGYSGGSTSDLLSQSQSLLSAVTSGTTTVKGSADLSQNDALSLTSPVQALQTSIQTLISDLNAKKCQLVAAGGASQVLSNLQQQKTASQALADAITSKVPQALQSIASQLSSGIATALQTGITDFQDTSSCPAASGGSSSASGSSSAPASSAASSSSGSGAPVSAPVATTTTASNSSVTTKSSPAAQTTNAAAAATAMGYLGAAAIAAVVGAAL